MKRLLHRLLPVCFSLLAFVALIGVRPQCGGWFYQPEVPAALKR